MQDLLQPIPLTIAGGVLLLIIVVIAMVASAGAKKKRAEATPGASTSARPAGRMDTPAPSTPAATKPAVTPPPQSGAAAPKMAASAAPSAAPGATEAPKPSATASPAATPKPGSVATAAPAAQAGPAPLIALDFSRDALDKLRGMDGAAVAGLQIVGGSLIIPPACGLFSSATVPARAGAKYRCRLVAEAASASTNGFSTNCLAGPIVRDAGGNIIQWWSERSLQEGKADTIEMTIEAPANAAVVQIGVCGSYSGEGKAGNGNVGLRTIAIYEA